MKWRIGKFVILIQLLIMSFQSVIGQQFALPPSDIYRRDRLNKVIITEAAVGTLASVGLYFLWYKKFPKSRFHFFNDNKEWLQMDKAGHVTTAYNIALIQHDLMRWCGVKQDASIGIGCATAIGYMSIIEIMDGFSKHWGFSNGDMLANILGTAIFASQQKWWNQQKIIIKFSYHPSAFAKYNPGELGNNWISRIIKDYNGQTYWLSLNVKSFLSTRSNFPEWANIAIGYGAEGMTGGSKNPTEVNGNAVPFFKRYRQFYLAPDADFFRINSSPVVNNINYLIRFSKIPSPTLEYNTLKKIKFHPIYY
jgi:hypothetical protein